MIKPPYYLIFILLFLQACSDSETAEQEETSLPLATTDYAVEIDRFETTTTKTFNYNITETINRTATQSNFSWDFGDGSFSSMCCGNHTFLAPGAYLVKVEITKGKETISISKEIEVGKTDNDNIAGFKSRGVLYKRILRDEFGNILRQDAESDPCQPIGNCLLDDLYLMKPYLTYDLYANQYNDCICLDVNGNEVIDVKDINGNLTIADGYWKLSASNERSFTMVRENNWTENFTVVYDCNSTNAEAMADILLETSTEKCDCGSFNLITNSGSKYIVAYVTKKIDGIGEENLRLEIDPGETINLDCNKLCSGVGKIIEIEITCADYYSPIF